MRKRSINNLQHKIKNYKILIFDLDNTIYNQKDYDEPALRNVSNFLSIKLNLNSKEIFENLTTLKKKKVLNIFNKFLENKSLKNNNLKILVQKSVQLYQNYKCKELNESSSLYNLLNDEKKTKILYLVTNGNFKRQKRKIKFLKISKFFKKIYILDGKRNYLKPSILSVKQMQNYIFKFGRKKAIYIGDDKIIDGRFANNLKVKYLHFKFS